MRLIIIRLVTVLTIICFASAVTVPTRPAVADGGQGLSLTTSTAIVILIPVFVTLIALNTLSFLGPRFRNIGKIAVVSALMTTSAIFLTVLPFILQRQRQHAMLASIMLIPAIYAIGMLTTLTVATSRPLLRTGYVQGLFFNSVMTLMTLATFPGLAANLFRTALRNFLGQRYGGTVQAQQTNRNLVADAMAGDPVALTVIRLLPTFYQSGRWPGYGLAANPAALTSMMLPSGFLFPGTIYYDRAYWDEILAEAEDIVECDECYYDAEEDAYLGYETAQLALLVAEDLWWEDFRDYGESRGLRIGRNVLLDNISAIKSKYTGDDVSLAKLRRLRINLTEAFGHDEEDEGPTYSTPFGYLDDLGSSQPAKEAFRVNPSKLQLYLDAPYKLSPSVSYSAAARDRAAYNEATHRGFGVSLRARF